MRIRKIVERDLHRSFTTVDQLDLFRGFGEKPKKRVFHHYENWEEYKSGMWRKVDARNRESLKSKAANLMSNPSKFKAAMRKVIKLWPISCESQLTDRNQTRIAWLGHAGCCMATKSPEDVTREAWWTLTLNQQDLANKTALEVIKEWEAQYNA